MPTGGGVAVRAEQVSRLCQLGSARIPALDVATLEVPAGEFLVPLGSSRSGGVSTTKLDGRPGLPYLRRHLRARPWSVRHEPARASAPIAAGPWAWFFHPIRVPTRAARGKISSLRCGWQRGNQGSVRSGFVKRSAACAWKSGRVVAQASIPGRAAAGHLGTSAGEPACPSSCGRANRQP
jgi:hypothetical protein